MYLASRGYKTFEYVVEQMSLAVYMINIFCHSLRMLRPHVLLILIIGRVNVMRFGNNRDDMNLN